MVKKTKQFRPSFPEEDLTVKSLVAKVLWRIGKEC